MGRDKVRAVFAAQLQCFARHGRSHDIFAATACFDQIFEGYIIIIHAREADSSLCHSAHASFLSAEALRKRRISTKLSARVSSPALPELVVQDNR